MERCAAKLLSKSECRNSVPNSISSEEEKIVKTTESVASALAVLLCACAFSLEMRARESVMEINTPPRSASIEERQVEQAERDECCSTLLREGRQLAQRFPTLIKNTESVTHSSKYGYVVRYARVESVVASNGVAAEVYSNVLIFARDGETVHTVIDYSQDE
jgi:hypothetical protein